MLIVYSANISAINFDYEKIDSITITSIGLFSTLSWDPLNKDNFDARSTDSKLITNLSNKKDLILFTSILNYLQEEKDFILSQNRIYERVKLKKLSDTIEIKKRLGKESSIFSTKLVKVKNKYYLSYHPKNDPIADVKCKIVIYESNKNTILWMSNFYIDMLDKRYKVSKSLFESINNFDTLFIENNR